VDKQEFVNKIADSIKQNNSLEFHKVFAERLNELLSQKTTQLKEDEDIDPEMDAVTKIQVAAKNYGAGEVSYDQGVLIAVLRNKQAAIEFSDWLEDCDCVDSYGMEVIHNKPLKGYFDKDDVDIDSITDDRNFQFLFTIYLDPELVQYAPYSGEEDEEEYDEDEYDEDDQEEMGESVENIDEVERKIKVTSRGQKWIKMQCPRGFKWNPETKACEKISGAELANMRKAIRKALITKKSLGNVYRMRIIRKMKKALRYRKQMGLSV
jgi:hypothetical protein